jgi:hypothetical protein
MKHTIKTKCVLIILAIFIAACAGNKKLAKVAINEHEEIAADSVEYELIVFDPGFETWFITHSKPEWYHSQEYYESWNKQYVSAWNSKAISPRFGRIFESTIDYDYFTDYGMAINHKLFYYFQYVEKELRMDILPHGTGPQTVL